MASNDGDFWEILWIFNTLILKLKILCENALQQSLEGEWISRCASPFERRSPEMGSQSMISREEREEKGERELREFFGFLGCNKMCFEIQQGFLHVFRMILGKKYCTKWV